MDFIYYLIIASESVLNRGLLYFQKGNQDADLGDALAEDPKLPSAYVNRANILMKRGDVDRAVADLDMRAF